MRREGKERNHFVELARALLACFRICVGFLLSSPFLVVVVSRFAVVVARPPDAPEMPRSCIATRLVGLFKPGGRARLNPTSVRARARARRSNLNRKGQMGQPFEARSRYRCKFSGRKASFDRIYQPIRNFLNDPESVFNCRPGRSPHPACTQDGRLLGRHLEQPVSIEREAEIER